MKKILFVCTGNICRSPTAEALLRQLLQEELGLRSSKSYHVDSAGTHAYHIDEPPDRRAVKVAKQQGIFMKNIVARKIKQKDFDEFDYILAMDRGHYNILKEMQPDQARAKLELFLNFSERHKGKDVPDPYYGEEKDFEEVLNLITEGAKDFLKHITGA